VHRAVNLTTFKCRLSWNLRTSTSWKPQGLSRPVMGLLLLYLTLEPQLEQSIQWPKGPRSAWVWILAGQKFCDSLCGNKDQFSMSVPRAAERVSSVGIATNFWLDDPGIEYRLGARFFPLDQTGPAFSTASYTVPLALNYYVPVTGARCWWRSWLRYCATSQKVAGLIADGVTGIFHWHNPSGRTMALGLSQPLTEMRTKNNCLG
jgi:hypothetical protein